MEETQVGMYLAKKMRTTVKDIQPIPSPGIDGYGFCSYVDSGRWDVTTDLSKDAGSDIVALCRGSKYRSNWKDHEVRCPDHKKYMYQFQANTNICCNRPDLMHEADESAIHQDCCINNYVPYSNVSSYEAHSSTKHGQNFCEALPDLACCSGSCERGMNNCVIPGKTSKGENICNKHHDNAVCSTIVNHHRIACHEDYVFDSIDSEYLEASSVI